MLTNNNTFVSTSTGHPVSINIPSMYRDTCEIGIYEYIIYTLEDGEFELLKEGKIYAESENEAREKVLFDFAKSEEGKELELEDLTIAVRLF